MRYLLLVRVAEGASPTPEEADPEPWIAEGERRGLRLMGEQLRDPVDATTVRVREDRVLTTDGPFAEYKEYVAGFDLIEAASIDEAVDYASRHPVTRFGAIEIREIWPFEP